MQDVIIPIENNPEPRGIPTMRFARVGDTVDIYINGQKIVVLDVDELKYIVQTVLNIK